VTQVVVQLVESQPVKRRLGWCEMAASLTVVSPVEFYTGGSEDRI
jgi:hypothetical protein